MKLNTLLMIFFIVARAAGEGTVSEAPAEESKQPAFINPSTRLHSNNRETRLQKLEEAYAAAQQKILDQVVWHVDPAKPVEKVEIHIQEQKLYAYQDNQPVGISPISTAAAGYCTPLGTYKITDKKELYFSNQYGEFADSKGNIVNYNANLGDTPPPGAHYVPSPMPHFMRLTDAGVGLHEGYLPGYPASHGCIRLPGGVAANLFRVVSIGTPVLIIQ